MPLVPAEDLEYFFLDCRHFFFAEQRINDAVELPGFRAAKDQILPLSFQPRFLETKPLAAHQQQGDHIAEVDTSRVGVAFQK